MIARLERVSKVIAERRLRLNKQEVIVGLDCLSDEAIAIPLEALRSI